MKQFFLKNIVLSIVIVLTLAASIVLCVFIGQSNSMISSAMSEIEENREVVENINRVRKPNSVKTSEDLIQEDIKFLENKTALVYRHFGRPYRSALLAFIRNIASTSELKEIPEGYADDSFKFVAKPVDKDEDAETDELSEDVEEAKPEAPTEEELKVFNPSKKLVVVKTDESSMRAMLGEIYKEMHVEVENDSDSFVIPDNVLEERYAIFAAFVQKLTEAPEEVNSANAEEFKKAALDKLQKAFAIFRDEVQTTTQEKVTNNVAKQMFLDSLGIPRLMRKLDCKNYIDSLYNSYAASNLIPGLPTDPDDESDRVRKLRDFIYNRLNPSVAPPPEMVIPVFRNFQIKEDLITRMNDAHIRKLNTLTPDYFYGSSPDGDPDSAILVFTYTIELQSTLDEINAFIDLLHTAYKDNRVYVLRNLKFTVDSSYITEANTAVRRHIYDLEEEKIRKEKEDEDPETAAENAEENKRLKKQTDANGNIIEVVDVLPTEPSHPDYGRVLLGEKRDEVTCTLVVDYYLYRGDNLVPDK